MRVVSLSSKRGRRPKAGACGRQVEEQAFTPGPVHGRVLSGNSQKRLEKDEEPDMGSKEGLWRHTEGTWGLLWGGGWGRNWGKQRHGLARWSVTLFLASPPSLPTGNVRNVMSWDKIGLPLHLTLSAGAGVFAPSPLIREGFLGGEVFSGHNSNGGST